jgi:hypothetical protein
MEMEQRAFFHYANSIVDGWFSNLFIGFLWIVIAYTLSKSEWKMSNVMSFTFFLTFILAIILKNHNGDK